MTDLDPGVLLSAYDTQLRPEVPDPLPPGATAETDGPVVRIRGLGPGGFLTYATLDGLPDADLDALIARQRDLFAVLGEPVEWKTYGHDRPADLPQRLRAAGFVAQPQETVMIGAVAGCAAAVPVLPDGVRLREVSSGADLARIAGLESAVWGEDRGRHVESLGRELAADPRGLTIVVAEAGEEVVAAGWVRYVAGTGFATLWAGSTASGWRRRGIYRALVTYRARLAHSRGFTMLQVDASADSRPVLLRMGFVAVTTTTPYVFDPVA